MRRSLWSAAPARLLATTLAGILLLAAGCSEVNEPLTPAGSIGGIVWDGPETRVADAAIVVGYEFEAEKAAFSDAEGEDLVDPDDASQDPTSLAMLQNYPNPFGVRSTLEFELPQEGEVSLDLYTHRGEHTATLLDAEILAAGRHVLDMRDLPNDVYVARLTFAVPGGTSYALVYGITALDGDPLTTPPTVTSDATGEFFLPVVDLACGIRVPVTAEEGPEITGWGRISRRVTLTARHEARSVAKILRLEDDSARYFLEMNLQ